MKKSRPQNALQELLRPQPSVFIGIIAQLTGNTLQDDIASCVKKWQQLGNDILNNPNKGCCNNPDKANKISKLSGNAF